MSEFVKNDLKSIKPRDPLEYLNDLLDDISFAIEEEDSVANHSISDVVNLKNAIKTFKSYKQIADQYKAYKIIKGDV